MNPIRRASLFPLLCLAAPLFAQGGEVDLRVVTKKGVSIWLIQEAKQENVMEMMGQQVESAHTVKQTLRMTVKDVDDKGNATVETTIARIHGSVSMPEPYGDSEFDSLDAASIAEGEQGGMIKAIMSGVGKTFSAKVDGNGRVVELLTDAAKTRGDGMSKEAMTQLIEGAFGQRPDKPTAPGAKWQHTKKEGGPLQVENKLELTLSKVDADSFEISAAGTVEKGEGAAGRDGENEEERAAREMMKNAKITNGKITGMQRVSRQDGFVLESTNTVSMDMEMSGPPMGDMQHSMKVTVSTKRTTEADAMPKKSEQQPADAPKDEKKPEPKEEKKEEPK